MAHLGSIGFELQSAIGLKLLSGAGVSAQTSNVHSGAASLKAVPISATRSAAVIQWHAGQNGPFYSTIHLFIVAYPSAEQRIIAFSGGSSLGAAHAAWITLDASGTLGLYSDAGALIGSRSPALSLNTWYRIETHFDKAIAAPNQVLETQLALGDGVATQWASSVSLTYTNQLQSIQLGSNLALEAQTVGEWYFDDVVENDGTGTLENSYPGPGYLNYYRIDGNADFTQLTPGGTASTANYGYVGTPHDKPTPDDAATTVSTNTLNQLDTYTLEDTGAEIGVADRIRVVSVYARYAGTGTGAGVNASLVFGIQSVQGGTKLEGAASSPSVATYLTGLNGNTNLGPNLIAYATPETAGWQKSSLDTAVVGVRCSLAAANPSLLSALWVQVLSVPQAPLSQVSQGLLLGVG